MRPCGWRFSFLQHNRQARREEKKQFDQRMQNGIGVSLSALDIMDQKQRQDVFEVLKIVLADAEMSDSSGIAVADFKRWNTNLNHITHIERVPGHGICLYSDGQAVWMSGMYANSQRPGLGRIFTRCR